MIQNNKIKLIAEIDLINYAKTHKKEIALLDNCENAGVALCERCDFYFDCYNILRYTRAYNPKIFNEK